MHVLCVLAGCVLGLMPPKGYVSSGSECDGVESRYSCRKGFQFLHPIKSITAARTRNNMAVAGTGNTYYGAIEVVQLDDGFVLKEDFGESHRWRVIIFNPADEGQVMVGTDDGAVSIFAVGGDGKLLGRMKSVGSHENEHIGGIAVITRPSGKHIVCVAQTTHYFARDSKRGKLIPYDPVKFDKLKEPIESNTDLIISLSLSHGGDFVVLGSENGEIIVWDSWNWAEYHRYRHPKFLLRGAQVIQSVDLRIVSVSRDGFILVHDKSKVYAESDGQVYNISSSHGRFCDRFGKCDGEYVQVFALTVSPDSRHFATCGSDGTAKVWDAQTGKNLLTFAAQRRATEECAVAFTHDGEHLLHGADSNAYMWNITEREDAPTHPPSQPTETKKAASINTKGCAGRCDSIFSEEQDARIQAVSLSQSGLVAVAPAGGAPLCILKRHQSDDYWWFYAVVPLATRAPDSQDLMLTFSPDEALLAVILPATTSFASRQGLQVHRTNGEPAMVASLESVLRSAAFTPDSRHLLLATDQGVLRAPTAGWGGAGAPQIRLTDPPPAHPACTSATFSAAGLGSVVVAGGTTVTGTPLVFCTDVADDAKEVGSCPEVLVFPESKLRGRLTRVAISDDGHLIAAASEDGYALWWSDTPIPELCGASGGGAPQRVKLVTQDTLSITGMGFDGNRSLTVGGMAGIQCVDVTAVEELRFDRIVQKVSFQPRSSVVDLGGKTLNSMQMARGRVAAVTGLTMALWNTQLGPGPATQQPGTATSQPPVMPGTATPLRVGTTDAPASPPAAPHLPINLPAVVLSLALLCALSALYLLLKRCAKNRRHAAEGLSEEMFLSDSMLRGEGVDEVQHAGRAYQRVGVGGDPAVLSGDPSSSTADTRDGFVDASSGGRGSAADDSTPLIPQVRRAAPHPLRPKQPVAGPGSQGATTHSWDGGADGEGGSVSYEYGGDTLESHIVYPQGGGAQVEGGSVSYEYGGDTLESKIVYLQGEGAQVEGGSVSYEFGGDTLESKIVYLQGEGAQVEGGSVSYEYGGDTLESKIVYLQGEGAQIEGGSVSYECGGDTLESTIVYPQGGGAQVEEGSVSYEYGGDTLESKIVYLQGEGAQGEGAQIEGGSVSYECGGDTLESKIVYPQGEGAQVEGGSVSYECGGDTLESKIVYLQGEGAQVEGGSVSYEYGGDTLESEIVYLQGGTHPPGGGAQVEGGSVSRE